MGTDPSQHSPSPSQNLSDPFHPVFQRSRWRRRRLTLISPTQRLERQPPKFSPASKPEWHENLQRRPQKKAPPLPLQRRKKLRRRRRRRRWLTLTWTTPR